MLCVKTFYIFTGFLISYATIKTFGIHDYGTFVLLYTVIQLLGIPNTTGIPGYVLRNGTQVSQRNTVRMLRSLLPTVKTINIVLAFIGSLLFVCIYMYLNTTNHLPVVWFFAFSILTLNGFKAVYVAALKLNGKVIVSQVFDLNVRQVSIVVSIFASGLMFHDLSYEVIVYCYTLSILLTSLLLRSSVSRIIDKNTNKKRYFHISLKKLKKYIFPVLTLSLIGGLTTLNRNIDILSVGIFNISSDVGIYKIAILISSICLLGAQVLSTLYLPSMLREFKTKQFHILEESIRKTSIYSTIFAAIIFIIFISLGRIILITVYGSTASSAYVTTIILMIGHIINCTFGPAMALFTLTKNEKEILIQILLALILNVILNLILVPWFGVEGAAIGTLVSVIFFKLRLRLIILKKFNIKLGLF